MRSLLAALAFLTALLSFTAYSPESVRLLAQKLEAIAYEREIRFVDAPLALEGYAREHLLAQRSSSESNIWWLINREQVRSELLSLPMVSDAEVAICSDQYWGCFEVAIHERVPGLIVVSGDRAWVVGTDGGVISSQSRAQIRRISSEIQLPIVEGAIIEGLSPEVLRARLSRTYRALHLLEASSGERVEHAEIAKGDEINIQLRNYDFLVRLTLSDQQSWESKLSKSGRRLRALIQELGTVQERIERIDLSYESLAVVKTDRKLEPS